MKKRYNCATSDLRIFLRNSFAFMCPHIIPKEPLDGPESEDAAMTSVPGINKQESVQNRSATAFGQSCLRETAVEVNRLFTGIGL